ncbi:MAG TPA: sulfite exporter TauE/SafE family protein [Hyphomicrobiaceae bacterium]|nr:sulfite exporter TauE/SafE family protein [Hyphomicrobiaceae bacterium]
METGISLGQLAVVALALVAAGVLTGFLAGMLGVGGGGIVAPVLFEVFGAVGVDPSVRMHLAIGTSLAVMVPTTMRSFMAHKARGGVDLVAWRRLGPAVVVGVAVGSAVARFAPGGALKILWVIFATSMSAKLVFGRSDWRLGDDLPKSWLVEAYGALVGAISTLLSVGGGAFITMLLTLYGRSMQTAVGTSAGIGMLVALPGTLGLMWAGWGQPDLPPLSVGYVSLLGAALLIPSSVLVAPLGARVAHGISRRTLELAFAALLSTAGLRFLLSLIM